MGHFPYTYSRHKHNTWCKALAKLNNTVFLSNVAPRTSSAHCGIVGLDTALDTWQDSGGNQNNVKIAAYKSLFGTGYMWTSFTHTHAMLHLRPHRNKNKNGAQACPILAASGTFQATEEWSALSAQRGASCGTRSYPPSFPYFFFQIQKAFRPS